MRSLAEGSEGCCSCYGYGGFEKSWGSYLGGPHGSVSYGCHHGRSLGYGGCRTRPGTVLSIPGVREEDKQIHLLGSDLEVLVIDVNEAVVTLQYLERYGNYGGARDLGVIQYALSFIVDAAVKGE